MSRPVKYSPELAATICARLSSGLSMRRLCRRDDMPHRATIFKWIAIYPDFRTEYMRALEARGCSYGEQVEEIAQRVLAGELAPDVARVAIDALKWTAGRMAPKVYGDRVAHEHTGKDGGPIQHVDLSKLSDDQLAQLEGIAASIQDSAVIGDPAREDATRH